MPLPAPGPPRTKRIVTLEGEKVGVSFLRGTELRGGGSHVYFVYIVSGVAESWRFGTNDVEVGEVGILKRLSNRMYLHSRTLATKIFATDFALHIPARCLTIKIYAPEPASVMAMNGQIFKGLFPGRGFGPLSPVA